MNYSEELSALVAKIESVVRAKIADEIRLGQAASIDISELPKPPETAQPPAAPLKQKSRPNGAVKRRKRSPTTASDQEIIAVERAMPEGETVTVAKLKDLTKHALNPKGVGQTTVAAACKALVANGVFEQVGRNGYRLAVQPAEQEQLENGEDSAQESPEA